MTAVIDPTRHAATLPWLLRSAAVASWFDLPRVMAVCALWLASLAPVVVAALTGVWWLVGISTLPAALVLTGLSRVAASIVRGERSRVRDVFRGDAVLALTLSGLLTVPLGLVASTDLQVVGYLAAAVTLVLAPYALAYGAMRDKRGIMAWRGALILVAFRPSWALTLLSVAMLGAFAIAATAGTLGLLVPMIVSVFANTLVARLVEIIEGAR